MFMGCGQSTTNQIIRQEALAVQDLDVNKNTIVALQNIQLIVRKSATENPSRDSLPVTESGTPEDDIIKAVYLVKSGDIQYRVPRLLPPEAASTIARRRRYRAFEAISFCGPDRL